MSSTQKSSLDYLLKEALETGGWQLVETAGNNENWLREGEWVKIGKTPLRGTTPPSIVFEIFEPGINFRKTDMLVMNLLCVRLAKKRKMSDWYDKLDTTE